MEQGGRNATSAGRSSQALQPVQLDDVGGYVEEDDPFGRRRRALAKECACRKPHIV